MIESESASEGVSSSKSSYTLPCGGVIVIAGPDGAGKTSLVLELKQKLSAELIHLHHRPGVLPRVSRSALPVIEPHGQRPYGTFLSALKILYVAADHVLGWVLRVRPHLLRGGFVMIERGWWDLAVDPKRYRLKAWPGVIRALGALLPAPDMVFILEAAPSVFRARKPELSSDEIERQLKAWKEVLPRHVSRVCLDASRPLEEIASQVATLASKVFEDKALFSSGAGWIGLAGGRVPRFTLPRGPRAAAKSGLLVYQPVTHLGFISWQMGRLFAALGGMRLLPRGRPPASEVRDAVAPYVAPGCSLAVARCNHPGRYVAAIVREDGGLRALAKIATSVEGRAALEREAEAIATLSALLPSPLSAPRVLGVGDGVLVLEGIRWRPRLAPWRLPHEVAAALGGFFRRGHREGSAHGPCHGDVAPWNILRTEKGWTLVDWEWARDDGPPFYDLFHFVTQSATLLGRPSLRTIAAGLDGQGPIARLIGAYADAAQISTSAVRPSFAQYLEISNPKVETEPGSGRSGLRRRQKLLEEIEARCRFTSDNC